MDAKPLSRDSILEQLGKVLSSATFENAVRSRALLKFIVEEAANGRANRLKEYTIGAEALSRGDSFDPRTDPIVRAEASRLRVRLERYYAAEGQGDPVLIVLPKGSYAPQFLNRGAGPAAAEPPGPSNMPPPSASRHRRRRWLAAGVLAAASLLAVIPWRWRRPPPHESTLVQFDVELKAAGVLGSEVGTDVVLSPDGKRIVYVSRTSDGVAHLNARRLDQPYASELPGTVGARGPFFSPEGRWVAFWAAGKLKKAPVDGGSPVILCDATDLLGGSWGEDGNIVASLGGNKLLSVSASGGTPVVVADLSGEHLNPVWPQILPRAKMVVFTAVGFTGPNAATIEALSFSTGKRTVMARGGAFGRYLPNGYLTYVNQGTVFAMPFDIDRMEPRGAAVPILEGVSYSSTFGFAQFDFSATGALVYRKYSGGRASVRWLDNSGGTEPWLSMPGEYLWPRLSPDGKKLALSVTEGGATSVWISEGPADRTTRLAAAGRSLPIWSPDGRTLILGGSGSLVWLRADGAGKPEPLLHGGNIQVPWSFTPDGSRLAYHERSSTGFDLWTVPVQSYAGALKAGNPEPFLQTPAYETYPAFSPDGRWMAYGSNESLNWEVYVRAFPDNGTKVKVSSAGGRIPFWSQTGRELFYRTDDQRIMAAAYNTKGGRFALETVREWTPTRLVDTGVLSNLDLAPDGKRIVALLPAAMSGAEQTQNHVTFMLNFFEELRRRVPPAKQ